MFPLLEERVINLKPFNKLAVIIKAKFLTFNCIIHINFRTKSIWGKSVLEKLLSRRLLRPAESEIPKDLCGFCFCF